MIFFFQSKPTKKETLEYPGWVRALKNAPKVQQETLERFDELIHEMPYVYAHLVDLREENVKEETSNQTEIFDKVLNHVLDGEKRYNEIRISMTEASEMLKFANKFLSELRTKLNDLDRAFPEYSFTLSKLHPN